LISLGAKQPRIIKLYISLEEKHHLFAQLGHAYPEARRKEILHAYQERSSLRGLTRPFGVSRTTLSSWIKKK